jgi:septum site-determining protein MinD
MGISVAIGAGKGGTGKTTFTSNLGVALGKLGVSVLLVDADLAMANLELHFKLEGVDVTLNDVLAGRARIEEALYRKHGVTILPAGLSLVKMKEANPERLDQALRHLENHYEMMLVDTPAGLGPEVIAALEICQAAILVVQPEISSLVDALKIKKVAQAYDTRVLGAVLNRFRDDSEIPPEDVAAILDTVVLTTLPEDPGIKASTMGGEPAVIRFPESAFSHDVMQIAADLIGTKLPERRKSSFTKRFFKRILGF